MRHSLPKHPFSQRWIALTLAIFLLLTGCAQVPQTEIPLPEKEPAEVSPPSPPYSGRLQISGGTERQISSAMTSTAPLPAA